MIVLPAVDIKDGKCVRLLKGDPRFQTIYEDDPLQAARLWESQGSRYLHCVDLDGAISGSGGNAAHVERIIRETCLRVEIGGGIRTDDDVARWLEVGAGLVVLGTRAVEDPGATAELCRLYPRRIVIAVDARDGLVSTRGWTQNTEVRAVDLVRELAPAGPAGFLYTDIERDGTLARPNFAATELLVNAVDTAVIASGGVRTIEDVERCGRIGAAAVIIGKALYDANVELPRAIEVAAGFDDAPPLFETEERV